MKTLFTLVSVFSTLIAFSANANAGLTCGNLPSEVHINNRYFFQLLDTSHMSMQLVLVDSRMISRQMMSKVVGGKGYHSNKLPNCDLEGVKFETSTGAVSTLSVPGHFANGGVATYRICEYAIEDGEKFLDNDQTIVCNWVTGD